MANDLDIYEAIAVAMADVREPDLSAFTHSAVRGALERVLRDPVVRANFLSWMNARVQALSSGRVSIEERPASAALPSPYATSEIPLRVVIRGEPFAESAILRADSGALHYPLRG